MSIHCRIKSFFLLFIFLSFVLKSNISSKSEIIIKSKNKKKTFQCRERTIVYVVQLFELAYKELRDELFFEKNYWIAKRCSWMKWNFRIYELWTFVYSINKNEYFFSTILIWIIKRLHELQYDSFDSSFIFKKKQNKLHMKVYMTFRELIKNHCYSEKKFILSLCRKFENALNWILDIHEMNVFKNSIIENEFENEYDVNENYDDEKQNRT